MFDKKGRWWPQRLADKSSRRVWRKLYRNGHGSQCAKLIPPFCSGCYGCYRMRNLGRAPE